jgi:protein-L-isoaspartate(D-aspartate) O-methyltransferase
MPDELSVSYERQRLEMVTWQIEKRGIRDAKLLQAMRSVPRHLFVPPEYRGSAYEDYPLPIGFGQTISQPYIVALMTELLHLTGEETVLEVGSGSGYQAAVLACLARQVHTFEFIPGLAERARQVLSELGLANVTVHPGDGSGGLPEYAPYQGILVTAAAPAAPEPLLKQLAPDGRLVLPAGGRYSQVLQVWRPVENGFEHEVITSVAFVPLRGKWGWKEL